MVTEPVPEALPGQLASFTFETSIAGSYAGKTHLVDALNYRYNFGILTSPISYSLTIPQPNSVFCVIFFRKKLLVSQYHFLHSLQANANKILLNWAKNSYFGSKYLSFSVSISL